MFTSASVTIGSTSREIRPQRIVRTSPEGNVRTVRVRPGRANQRREAISASLGYRR